MPLLPRVAFLGLGTMGGAMATNLLRAGFVVDGWNRSRARVDRLVEAGMRIAETPRDAAATADVIVTCLANDDALRAVALDSRVGLHVALRSEAIVCDCGTTSLALTRELADAVCSRGATFVDAPITGSKLGAEGARLTFMVGGPVATVERLEPLFRAMGKHVVHVAPEVGAGQAAKYCLNMIQAVMLEGLLEGYVLAKHMGVPLDKMHEVVENSAAKSGVGSFKTPYLWAGDFAPHFRLDLMQKDLHLALAEASARRVPLPAATTVVTLYDQGVAEGLGGEDFLVLARLLERWGGTQLRHRVEGTG